MCFSEPVKLAPDEAAEDAATEAEMAQLREGDTF